MTSLRVRVVRSLLIGLAVLFLLQWILVTVGIRRITENYAAARLQHEIETLLAGLEPDASGHWVLDTSRVNLFYERPFSGHYYVITAGDTTLHSRSLWDWTLAMRQAKPGESQRWHAQGPQSQPLLVLSEGFNKQGTALSIAVAEDLSQVNADIRFYQSAYAVLSLAFLLIMSAVTAWSVRRSLRPLEQTRAQLIALERGEVRALDEQVPAEIRPLVQQINRLLHLMLKQLERSRKVAGNLAHGLKTPLTVLSRLGTDSSLDTGESARRTLTEQVERMREMIDWQLKRARLAGGPGGTQFATAQDLAALAQTLERLYAERGLTIEVDASSRHRYAGDREDMLELFGNLMDNACQWARHRVQVSVVDSPGLTAVIADDGPGVDAARTQELLQRGTRLDQSGPGHGLGLAIVGDIVQQYGGTLTLSRSPTLGGLQVEVRLPEFENP